MEAALVGLVIVLCAVIGVVVRINHDFHEQADYWRRRCINAEREVGSLVADAAEVTKTVAYMHSTIRDLEADLEESDEIIERHQMEHLPSLSFCKQTCLETK